MLRSGQLGEIREVRLFRRRVNREALARCYQGNKARPVGGKSTDRTLATTVAKGLIMVETTVPAHPCAPAAPAFFSLRAKYSIEPGASVGQLAEDARCLIRTGLAALESYVMQHAVGVNHETVWAAGA